MSTGNTTAVVQPGCVARGGTARLRVTTAPKRAVGYVAVYSDGKSGAAPPWGKGYGGNGGDFADSKGVYVADWVVSPQAPVGNAYVSTSTPDGTLYAPFRVVSAVGGCD